MSKSYLQLTKEEHIEICIMRQEGKVIPRIAKALG